MSKQKVNVIYSETDYTRFRLLDANRDARTSNKILESINRVGYVSCPIMVNERMEIVDGQNRFYALQALGLPIEYYVVEGVGIEEARSLNLGQANWTTKDFIKSYVQQGNLNYIRLYDIIENIHGHSIASATGVISNVPTRFGLDSDAIRNGTYKVSEKAYNDALKVIKYINDLGDTIDRMKWDRMIVVITTIAWCLRVGGVDRERFCKTLEIQYPTLNPVVEVVPFLQDLSDMYNKSQRKGNRVIFDAIYRQSI